MVTANASGDIIVAIELPGSRLTLGVQWHPESLPEMEEHRAIFEAFITAAKE